MLGSFGGKSFLVPGISAWAEIHHCGACLPSGLGLRYLVQIKEVTPDSSVTGSSGAEKPACKAPGGVSPQPTGSMCCCGGNDGLATPLWPWLEICIQHGQRHSRKEMEEIILAPLSVFHIPIVFWTRRKGMRFGQEGEAPNSSLTGR